MSKPKEDNTKFLPNSNRLDFKDDKSNPQVSDVHLNDKYFTTIYQMDKQNFANDLEHLMSRYKVYEVKKDANT